MGTPIPTVAGGGNLALDSRSSMVLQEEAGEDGGPKTQAPASAGLGRQISGVASSKFLQTDKYGCAGVDMATLPSELVPEELSGQEADQQRSKHTISKSVNVKKSLLVKRKSSAVNAPKPPTEKRRKSSASNVQFVRSPLLNRILASPRMRHSRDNYQRSPYARLSCSTLPDDTRMAASPNLGRDSSRTVKRHKSINRAQGRRSTAVEEDEVGEDEGDEASKIQALNSGHYRNHMKTLPFEAMLEDVGQQRRMQHQGGKDAASRRSVDRIKFLLSKRKSSIVNASNHSERMQRKSSASHVHFVRSPILNRMLQSPRMSQSPVLSARSSSSSSSDDTRMVISPDLGPVMASKMKLKFEKYWDICMLQICVPVVLDPRFKFSFISFRLNAGFGDKGPAYTEIVKATIQNLFYAYSSMAPDLNYSQPESNDVNIDEDDCWADFEQHLAAQKRKRVKSELDTYLQDDLFPRQKKFDILQWWMMHSAKYPVVSRMARDVLAAPASTVASESAFSTSGRIVSDYRSRLTSKKVQALVCLQDWLRAEGLSDVKLSEDDIGDGDDQDI